MDITVQPLTVTKEMILQKVSEEQLMEHYLGIRVQKGLVKSPLRNDKNPTCSFYRNKAGKLIFKDFGSDFCGDFITVVMHQFNCSFYKALQIVANDFNIIKRPDLAKNKAALEYTNSKLEYSEGCKIQVEIRPFQEYELKWWAKYGITEKTLKKFNIFSCKNVFLNGNVFKYESPNQLVFGYYGGVNSEGVELWRIYMPDKRSKKYKFISNWPGTKIQGGPQLPKDGGDYLCITKSLKDVATLYEFGVPAIAPCSENQFITDAQLEKVKKKFKHIVVLYDNDLPGIAGLVRIKKKHPELKFAFIPRSMDAKDISDFRKLYGDKKTKELVQKAIDFYTQDRSC